MKAINPDKLFALFDASDEQVYHEEHKEELLDNPYVLMGMVVRGMENFHLINDIYLYKHGEQYKAVKHIVQTKYFNRLFRYLERIDFNTYDNKHMIGQDFEVSTVMRALNYLLAYFEKKEEYEKCALIMKYLELLSIERLLL